MLQSPEDGEGAHPYWYARVMGIFHANIQHTGVAHIPEAPNYEILWLHWLGVEPGYRSGRRIAHLPKIGYVPEADKDAFGFLDPFPGHMRMPPHSSFVDGQTSDLLGH